MAKSKNKPILIFSSSADSLRKITCSCCDRDLVVASVDRYCPICFSEFRNESKPVSLSASSSSLEPRVKCEECNAKLFSNSLKDNAKLASSMFCPKCGGARVVAMDDSDEPEEEFNENEYDDIEASTEEEFNEGDYKDIEQLSGKVEYDDIEEELAEEEEMEASARRRKRRIKASNEEDLEYDDVEEEEMEASNDEEFDESEYVDLDELEASVSSKKRIKASTCEDGSECEDEEDYSDLDAETLEASFLKNPEPTWMFSSNGNPVIKIKKSKLSADSHMLFDTDKFPKLFINRVKESCFATAIKDFSAEVFTTASLMNIVDLENMAFEKLQSSIIPKFQDCMALTVEGAAKGVYPELNQELKASFFDAFVSRGMPESKTKEAIEASFLDSGATVFSSIIAKATELMYKKKEAYSELKATIQASGTVRKATEEDIDTKEFKAKLKAGNLPFSTNDLTNAALQSSIAKTSINSYRDRIKFKKS